MYWNRSAADISAAWQAEIESKLETGATATLVAGAPDNVLHSTATLLGLQNSTLQRNDIATPLLVAGGNSAVWLGLLLSPQPSDSDAIAPAPTLVYGGADAVTYLALLNLTTAQAEQPFSTSGAIKLAASAEMGVQFTPRLQPGAATAWEMLPLVEVGEQPTPTLAPAALQADSTTDWIAWGIMLLVLCLVLSALLI